MAPRPEPEEGAVVTHKEKDLFTPDGRLKISSGFSKYPTNRDVFLKNPIVWMEGKKIDDDVGTLWRVHDKLYDVTDFIDKHPGGKYWLETTRGSDVTESFESSHVGPSAEAMLKKFYVKDADKPRVSPFTFKEGGFYKTMKAKAWTILKESGTGPSLDMFLMQDSMLFLFIFLCIMGALQRSVVCIVISSIFLSFSVATSHNFFHQKDNWRMYIFDLMLFSSREWRISHALSHHNFPNTIYDYEISSFEPHMWFLAMKDKSFLHRYGTIIPGYLTFILALWMDMTKRFVLILKGTIKYHWTYGIVFWELLLMCFFSLSIIEGLKLWVILHTSAGIIFLQIGLVAAHHHPEIFHEGDVHIKDKDFGLAQVLATRDRGVVMTNLFLTSISFGNHTLHHLFPTVDHSKLPLLIPTLLETCKEFDVEFTLMTQWDLLKGFYTLMTKDKPNPNPPKIIKERKE